MVYRICLQLVQSYIEYICSWLALVKHVNCSVVHKDVLWNNHKNTTE